MQVTVAIVGSRHEADMIVGLLQSHDIPARVSGDDAGGLDLALQAQGVRVLVDSADEEAARTALGESTDPRQSSRSLNAFQRWMVRILGGDQ